MQFETYLFDFDGTLVDSMPTYISIMLKILDVNNIKYFIFQNIVYFIKQNRDTMFREKC